MSTAQPALTPIQQIEADVNHLQSGDGVKGDELTNPTPAEDNGAASSMAATAASLSKSILEQTSTSARAQANTTRDTALSLLNQDESFGEQIPSRPIE
jgi:hypothetical protein